MEGVRQKKREREREDERGGGTVFNYENVQRKAVVLISTGTGWYREWYNDENGCTKRYQVDVGCYHEQKANTRGRPKRSTSFYIFARG